MQHKLSLWLAVILLAPLLAACGAAAGEDVPSLDTGHEPPAAGAESAAEPLDNETMVMNFVQCMRDEGIEFKDPVVDADGNVQQPELVEGVSISREELAEPYAACSIHIEGLTFGREEANVSAQVEALLPVMACLRDKGYNVDDPTVETFAQWGADFRATFAWDNPTAQADFEECSVE